MLSGRKFEQKLYGFIEISEKGRGFLVFLYLAMVGSHDGGLKVAFQGV